MRKILMFIAAFAIAGVVAALIAAFVFEATAATSLMMGWLTLLTGVAILFVGILWALSNPGM